MKRSGIIRGLSLPALTRYWTGTTLTPQCGHTVTEQGWGQATPQLSYLLQKQVPRRLLIAWIADWYTPVPLSQLRERLADSPSRRQGCASRLQRALRLLTTALECWGATVALRSPSEKGHRPRVLFVALPPTWEMNPPLKLIVCCQSHDHHLYYSTVQINTRLCSQHYLKSLKDRREFSRVPKALVSCKSMLQNIWTPQRSCWDNLHRSAELEGPLGSPGLLPC